MIYSRSRVRPRVAVMLKEGVPDPEHVKKWAAWCCPASRQEKQLDLGGSEHGERKVSEAGLRQLRVYFAAVEMIENINVTQEYLTS